MNRSCVTAIATMLISVSACVAATGKSGPGDRTIHIAPGGKADADGSAAKPFATPADALSALKKRSAAERLHPTRVILHGGTYTISSPLKLGTEEGGTEAAPVFWQAAGDGTVAFSGGIAVPASAIRPVTDKETLSRLPERKADNFALFEIRLSDLGQKSFPELLPRGFGSGIKSSWPELFQDGKPLPLSCWPEGIGYAGGFKPAKIVQPGKLEGVDKAPDMAFQVGDARVKRWKTAVDKYQASVWFGGHWFWDWADDFLPAKSIDADGVVTMAR